MKKGDVVTIRDGSWTRSVEGGKLIHELLSDSVGMGRQYMIVETGCIFPNTGSGKYLISMGTFNNTVIQALSKGVNRPLDRGKVVFIEERFLQSVTKPIREVTMAEVYRQFGEDVKIKKD